MSANIAVEPESGRFESLRTAVVEGGGQLCTIDMAEGLVWADYHRPELLKQTLAGAPRVRWVALPFSGIDPYVPYLDRERTWTCARSVYARPVAEHAIALGLTGLRGLSTYARADTWLPPEGHNLVDGNVVIFGAGGITRQLLSLLSGFRCDISVVRRTATPMDGASRTVNLSDRLSVLEHADLVILALALTPETTGVIGKAELDAMPSHSWLVNVARGKHVDLDALVEALDHKNIGGACLDVTDPEPLPDGHPLWSHERAIITPHVGNTPEMGIPLLASHIRRNVELFSSGEPLEGVINVEDGY